MPRRLAVDVVGCGEIAQIMHLPNLFELSDMFTLRAVCDTDPHVLDGVRRRFGAEAGYTDHKEMIADGKADAVVVLHSGDHAGVITDALDTGHDVFVEKPLCYSTEDARDIANRAAAEGRTVMVGYSRLFDTAFQTLQETMAKVDGPAYVRAEASLPMDYYYRAHHDVLRPLDWTPPVQAPEWGGSWSYFHEELLCNLAIHEIYCLRALTGMDTPTLSAVSDVLDRRGVEASWQNGTDRHASMGVLTMDTVAGGYVEEFRVVTGSHTYLLEYPSIYLKNWPAKLSWTTFRDGTLVSSSELGSFVEPFKAELEHFHRVVTEDVPCLSPAADAVHDVDTLNRIYAAAKNRGSTA